MIYCLAYLLLCALSSAAYKLGHDEPMFDQPTQLWDIKLGINISDGLYAGLKPIPDVKHIEIYNGRAERRTYANHPITYARNESVYVIYSSAFTDEDTLGQTVWLSYSHDGGNTWNKPRPMFLPPLLEGQVGLETFKYHCDRGHQQRALQPAAIIEHEGTLYAIAQTCCYWCCHRYEQTPETCSLSNGSGKVGAGRIAMSFRRDGEISGDPCWLETNSRTNRVFFHKTVYGTSMGLRVCTNAQDLRGILDRPDAVPAWGDIQYNERKAVPAADTGHKMGEVTHAVWHPESGIWQRFWRDVSYYNNSYALWVEYSRTGLDWYPRGGILGGNSISQTNIPDARSKSFFFRLYDEDVSVLVHNPRANKGNVRQPLTVATARGKNVMPFTNIGVLRTNASNDISPDTRRLKFKGFQYPSAARVGDDILIAYSENKENIWVSIMPIRSLP